MTITSLFILALATIVSIQLDVQKNAWFMGAVVYGVIAFFGFDWSWKFSIVYYSLIGLAYLLSIETSWQKWVSRLFYKNLAHFIPKLSPTEEQALKSGDAWLEEMIFTGDIQWENLSQAHTELSTEEQQFINEEVAILCSLLDDWQITRSQDLPTEAWNYIRENGFLGLVISKEYGGKGFSARAHSDIIFKIASRSPAAAVTVMVPNSLGPGELLMHYGTDDQKKYYLPRLAQGLEIPCFALTEPEAGSDATSIQSEAIVCMHQGELSVKMDLNKRWITLAPIATLIGLAVNLKDPEHLLGGVGQEGITCILIERNTPHLEIGPRHLPAGQAFMNGTIKGHDIIVPIKQVIGGQAQAGNGWHMLVECLSIGRSISLPSLATASSAVAYLTAGAFARLRRQFNTEIVHFEGIQEKLAGIAGLQYLINANRLMTLAAVDAGKKPAVVSAIAKYFNTELGRIVVNEAMDVHGGRTVVDGPRNYLLHHYEAIPISITVEGANIMSRNLLIFGQGSMVCHPYVREEFYAIRNQDEKVFHEIFWKHVNYSIHVFCKALVSSWTGGLFLKASRSSLKKSHFLRLCFSFAWLADFSLVTLGGQLKRKERLSARLADAFSYLYLALAVFADLEKRNSTDKVVELQAQWALQYCYAKAQKALIDFMREYPSRIIGLFMKLVVAPFGQTYHMPNDQLEKNLALEMSKDSEYRDYLRNKIYLSGDARQPVDRMEFALQQYLDLLPVYQKLEDIRKYKFDQMEAYLNEQVEKRVILAAEKEAILAAESARYDSLQVDVFPFNFQKNTADMSENELML
ncbi:MAG TPA: acyl-CoA dehydrogenase [Legionellales bacterium]|nr:acyl-CoA dehydrogenase [Legionellales bacterium]